MTLRSKPGLRESSSAIAVGWRLMMFDPVSYIHPGHFALPESLSSPRQRAVVNEILIVALGLDTHWPFDRVGIAERAWLLNWRRLPQVAYLMGCQALKAGLCRRAALLSLPAWATAFARLPLLEPTSPTGPHPPSHADLLAEGFSRLTAMAAPLPEPVRQRLPLLFASNVARIAHCPGAFDLRLFVTALQYAKKHPHSPPDAGH